MYPLGFASWISCRYTLFFPLQGLKQGVVALLLSFPCLVTLVEKAIGVLLCPFLVKVGVVLLLSQTDKFMLLFLIVIFIGIVVFTIILSAHCYWKLWWNHSSDIRLDFSSKCQKNDSISKSFQSKKPHHQTPRSFGLQTQSHKRGHTEHTFITRQDYLEKARPS